eukprot:10190819-Heterocapsa_arctica.AAC.1
MEQINNKRSADEDEDKEMGKAKQAKTEHNSGTIAQDVQSQMDKRVKFLQFLRDKDNTNKRQEKRGKHKVTGTHATHTDT